MTPKQYPALGETIYEQTLPNGLKILVAKKPGFRKFMKIVCCSQ